MILALFRNGVANSVKLVRPLAAVQQNASITGKAFRGGPIERPAPYPYKTKGFGWTQSLFDTTEWRFDENTKVIVVDGPIAAGKTAFAKALAEDLECLHLPEVTMDNYYINSYGYDLRQLDPQLPEPCRSHDVSNFCRDPRSSQNAFLQYVMFQMRYSQYVDALSHLMNTGQGVVLERSPYSDYVFLEAMAQEGYISKAAKKGYYQMKENVMPQLLQPHLVIYLDVPVPVVQQRIKERGLSYEINGKALTPAYLNAVEKFYKQDYLKECSNHAELMVYDWSQGGDVEAVIEDIERIDFDKFEEETGNPKMRDWRFKTERFLTVERMKFTNNKNELMGMFQMFLEVPELYLEAMEFKALTDAVYNAPGMKFADGFNADMGDKNILFKVPKRTPPDFIR